MTVQIKVDQPSVLSLNQSGQVLMMFKAVMNSDRATRPLLWARGSSVSVNNTVTIGTSVSVFTSTQTSITQGTVITPGFSKTATKGDLLTVRPDMGGGGEITRGGDPKSFTFDNQTSQGLFCGLGQKINGTMANYCAAPLHGNSIETFQPDPKVLLGFSSAQATPGEYIENLATESNPVMHNMVAVSQLVLVEPDPNSPRKLTFETDTGWDWGHAQWATGYSGITDLASVLVQG